MALFGKKDKEASQAPVEEIKEKKEKKPGLFAKLRQGLAKTRSTLFGGIFASDEKVDDEFFEELEDAMIMADMGFDITEDILMELKAKLKVEKISDRKAAKQALIGILTEYMENDRPFLDRNAVNVILIVGVNGVGKTTSIGKLAAYYKADGWDPMLAAADTFRAAAAEQLTVWAERAEVPIIKHGEGADPAAVVFDAIAAYKSRKHDLLICDTAGRLHNKKNLMNELAKMRRVVDRELPGAHVEVLLVLDATTGQNAIAQAKAFGESCGLTGIILTKLDGTAKGGVVVAVKDELDLPIRFVGVGEGIDDLQPFDPESFAEALLAN
jgi:fused signal recognition particle receptor